MCTIMPFFQLGHAGKREITELEVRSERINKDGLYACGYCGISLQQHRIVLWMTTCLLRQWNCSTQGALPGVIAAETLVCFKCAMHAEIFLARLASRSHRLVKPDHLNEVRSVWNLVTPRFVTGWSVLSSMHSSTTYKEVTDDTGELELRCCYLRVVRI